jgi:S1-C subfamily serine protease
MNDDTDILGHLSDGLADRADAAADHVVGVRGPNGRHVSGLLWQADLVVSSEQSLPRHDEFEIVRCGGEVVKAQLVGRDPSTNVALLRLAQASAVSPYAVAAPRTGGLALAYGSDGKESTTARFGVVRHIGPAWQSSRGGQIDRNIVLDIGLSRHEEGGPVFDARRGLIGMSTFGLRRQVIVIPSETLNRIVPLLQRDGRIARGWLGIKLQPVEVPDALQTTAGQTSALMAMSVADDSPASKSGIVAGDIILSVGGVAVRRLRRIAALLGSESIGTKLDLQVIRGGTIHSLSLTITARPSG